MYLCAKSLTMELDSSVSLSVDRELDVNSALEPEKFAAKVLSCMPEDVRSAPEADIAYIQTLQVQDGSYAARVPGR